MDKKKRLGLQSIFTLLQNANLKGFFTGTIYQGSLKNLCVPGLNCYSCPGALGSCPIGALQNALSSYRFQIPYYVVGMLLFFGTIFGRIVCGFLCPFGLIQDLLYRIPFVRKIRTFRGDRPLRLLKYVILVFMVILLPIAVKLTPFFCKYLCPSGTLAGILLSFSDHSLYAVLGKLFAWKVMLLLAIVLLSIRIARPFCRYLCPLGAIYGLCNKISLVQMNIDTDSCIGCGKCASHCEMGIDPSQTPNHTECIRCTSCIESCPTHALNIGLSIRNSHTNTLRDPDR